MWRFSIMNSSAWAAQLLRWTAIGIDSADRSLRDAGLSEISAIANYLTTSQLSDNKMTGPNKFIQRSYTVKLKKRASLALIAGVICGVNFFYANAQAVAAQSDSDRIRDLEQKLDQSQQIIQELVVRLNKLESVGQQPAQTGASRASEERPAQPVASNPGITLPLIGTPIHGFADVGGVIGKERGKRKGFTVGSLDLFMTPELGDNVKGLIETVFEVDSEGSLAVDLERLQLGYSFGDYLTAWMGRFHTPFGYWNTAFHHGQQIQTAARRPQFIDFEDKGGILPTHTVGLWGHGGIGLGNGRLAYDLFFGNAPTLDDGVLNMNMGGLRRFKPSVGANIGYEFRDSLDGLKVGLHWLNGEVRNVNLDSKTRMNAAGGYVTYLNEPWEVLSELYRFDNTDITGKSGSHGSWALFGQLGRSFGRWTPYGRVEWTSLNRRDPYFRDMESGVSYTRGAFGVRYDLTSKAALKLEYRHTATKDSSAVGSPPANNSVETQFAIRF